MRSFKNKVVVITGAGSGIGKALARTFADQGALLALNDYNQVTLEETIEELKNSTRVFSKVFDVSKEEEMNAFAKDVIQHYGRVDVVVNNAGVAQEGTLVSNLSTKDFEWLLDINMWGMIHGSRAFLPYLRQQKTASLVNISSIFGMIGVPGMSSYSVSKFAVRAFSEALYLEERIHKTGVVVSSVHPGGINTNIAKSARGNGQSQVDAMEKALVMPPKKAARIIVKGIQRKKSRILVGLDAYLIYYLDKYARGLLNYGIMYNYKKYL